MNQIYKLVETQEGAFVLSTEIGPVICPWKQAIPIQQMSKNPISGQMESSLHIQKWSCDSQCQNFKMHNKEEDKKANVETTCGCKPSVYSDLPIEDKEDNKKAESAKLVNLKND